MKNKVIAVVSSIILGVSICANTTIVSEAPNMG